ncbi:hypothetical protein H4219_004017 [Mycoemilia scoparia]|uniref:Ras-GEF domain-containing protein n=1 Tax=Mycoemilia scoparia TaxID=417184 RepID=A0A9W8A2G5_9FUNG|nr:hypothetical protein H4219_004017 [Mycoemilia scoparia]
MNPLNTSNISPKTPTKDYSRESDTDGPSTDLMLPALSPLTPFDLLIPQTPLDNKGGFGESHASPGTLDMETSPVDLKYTKANIKRFATQFTGQIFPFSDAESPDRESMPVTPSTIGPSTSTSKCRHETPSITSHLQDTIPQHESSFAKQQYQEPELKLQSFSEPRLSKHIDITSHKSSLPPPFDLSINNHIKISPFEIIKGQKKESISSIRHLRISSDPDIISRHASLEDSVSPTPSFASFPFQRDMDGRSEGMDAFRTISRTIRGLKIPVSPHKLSDLNGTPKPDTISLSEAKALSNAEAEAIRSANDILEQHFGSTGPTSSKSRSNSRRHYQIFKNSGLGPNLDNTNFQFSISPQISQSPSNDSDSRQRHDSIMTINFSDDVNTESPFDAEANIKGHQVARRARKVEKLLGTDVDRSAIIRSFKRQDKMWYLEPMYDKFDISFDMEGKVDGGTWEALIEYLVPPGPAQVDYQTAFLLTFRAFASSRQFCDALIKRHRLQPPDGIDINQIKIWQEKKQRPVQLKVYQIIRSWYTEYWFCSEDDSCLPRLTEFLSSEASKNPRLSGHKLRACQKLIEEMEKRMRNDTSWISREKNLKPNPIKPKNKNPLPGTVTKLRIDSEQDPAELVTIADPQSSRIPTNETSVARGLFRNPLKTIQSNPSPRNHGFLLPRLRSHSHNNVLTSNSVPDSINECSPASITFPFSRKNHNNKKLATMKPENDRFVNKFQAATDCPHNSDLNEKALSKRPLQNNPSPQNSTVASRLRNRSLSDASAFSIESVGSIPDSTNTSSDIETEIAELLRVTIGVDLTYDMLRHMRNITQIPPSQIAIQITILQSDCFCHIQPYELLRGEFSKKENSLATNIKNMTRWSTQISRWVAYSILKEQTPEKRCRVLKYFIRIGSECLHMKNYDAVMAIQGGLNSAAILRLKKTWALLPSKLNRLNISLQNATKSDRNYSEYRATVRNSEPPLLPFLGLYLTDLTFINDGNPDMRRRKLVPAIGVDDETWALQRERENMKAQDIHAYDQSSSIDITSKSILINFDKHYKVAAIIREIQKFQVEYKGNFLMSTPALSEYLIGEWDRLDGEGVDEDLLYNMSLKREPREVVLPSITANHVSTSSTSISQVESSQTARSNSSSSDHAILNTKNNVSQANAQMLKFKSWFEVDVIQQSPSRLIKL